MADEENQSTTTTLAAETAQVTGQPVTPPAEQKFTQDDLNRFMAKAREEGRRSATKEQPKPEPVKADDGDKLTLKELKAQLDETNRRADFEKKIRRFGLDDEGADDFYDLYKAQKPSDADWFDKKAKLFVKTAVVQPAPVQPAATATPAPVVANPAAALSAPSGHGLPMQNGVTDLFSLTDQQRKDLGPMGVRKVLEQLQGIGNSDAGIPQRPKPPSQR